MYVLNSNNRVTNIQGLHVTLDIFPQDKEKHIVFTQKGENVVYLERKTYATFSSWSKYNKLWKDEYSTSLKNIIDKSNIFIIAGYGLPTYSKFQGNMKLLQVEELLS